MVMDFESSIYALMVHKEWGPKSLAHAMIKIPMSRNSQVLFQHFLSIMVFSLTTFHFKQPITVINMTILACVAIRILQQPKLLISR
jgi:hypothetical protein